PSISRQSPASVGRSDLQSPSHALGAGPLEYPILDTSSPRSQRGISPAVPRAEMGFCSPVQAQRVSPEPLSDLIFTQHAIFVTDQVRLKRSLENYRPLLIWRQLGQMTLRANLHVTLQLMLQLGHLGLLMRQLRRHPLQHHAQDGLMYQ
ncbi:hypothetical protein WJX84_009814, partial [Apatococcus fuscideae]